MVGYDDAETFLARLLELLPVGSAADVRLRASEFGTMRFANGHIHQPHLERLTELSLRVAIDRRLATVTTFDLSRSGRKEAVRRALALARVAPEEPKFPGFPGGGSRPPVVPYSAATARATPEEQGRWAARLIDGARSSVEDGRVAGVAHIGETWLAVANTAGRSVRTRRSIAAARVLVERPSQDPPPSGWSEAAHFDLRRLDPEALGREAGETLARQAPEPLAPDRYRVLLSGSATATLLSELGHLGFGARGAEEGWSALTRRWGRRVAPEGFTLVDDARSPLSLPQGIDQEGLSKRRTVLIDDGIATGPVLDLVTAARLGRRPTGHAWPPEAPWGELGATPQNMIVRPGSARSLEELIRETRRGVLVNRFHYVRTVDPARAILTGMTRDGTYRIERGEVVAPVRNLRFTESILTALAGAELWGRELRCYANSDERGAVSVTAPALLTRAFRFTSATVF